MAEQTMSYNAVAKSLHWIIALLILCLLVMGWTMDDIPNGPDKFWVFQLHKSFGITVLLLSVFRLVWRIMHRAPPLPVGTPKWEIGAAHMTHALFYVMIIGMPLSGWAMVSASALNIPTMLYGVVHWPNMPIISTMENKKHIGHLFGEMHELGGFVMAGLIALHVGAALKHHFISRDDIVLRMAPNFLGGFLNLLRGKK